MPKKMVCVVWHKKSKQEKTSSCSGALRLPFLGTIPARLCPLSCDKTFQFQIHKRHMIFRLTLDIHRRNIDHRDEEELGLMLSAKQEDEEASSDEERGQYDSSVGVYNSSVRLRTIVILESVVRPIRKMETI